MGTEYPHEILPASMVGAWIPKRILQYDRPNKWANETHICLAPDYEGENEWEKAVDEEDEGEDEGDDEDANEDEEE